MLESVMLPLQVPFENAVEIHPIRASHLPSFPHSPLTSHDFSLPFHRPSSLTLLQRSSSSVALLEVHIILRLLIHFFSGLNVAHLVSA